MSGFLFDSTLGGLQQVLDLRSQQHALTASNLANADTPGFKAKHLDFEHALGDAMDRGDRLAMHRTSQSHLDAGGAFDPNVIELEPTPWSADDNSVLPEREMARLQENSLMYRAVSTGMSKKLALLKFAASDGRG
jgi:flagellar basal-body rod protein FlgB